MYKTVKDAASSTIRRACSHEAEELSELAFRSKASWGYDSAFMATCRAELTVTPAYLAKAQTFVYETSGRVLGFYGLMTDTTTELGFMFVEPECFGSGVGRALFEHALQTAQGQGVVKLVIASDPGAAGFYQAMGAQRIAETPSASIPGRMLPTFEILIGRSV